MDGMGGRTTDKKRDRNDIPMTFSSVIIDGPGGGGMGGGAVYAASKAGKHHCAAGGTGREGG